MIACAGVSKPSGDVCDWPFPPRGYRWRYTGKAYPKPPVAICDVGRGISTVTFATFDCTGTPMHGYCVQGHAWRVYTTTPMFVGSAPVDPRFLEGVEAPGYHPEGVPRS